MDDRILAVCGTTDRLELALAGGDVVRYHTEGPLRKQPVSEHSWRVVIILLHFWPESGRHVICAAIYHDVAERWTGDVPAQIKWHDPQLADHLRGAEQAYHAHMRFPHPEHLSAGESRCVEIADRIEAAITCRSQTSRNAHRIYQRLQERIEMLSKMLDPVKREMILAFMTRLDSDDWSL